MKKGKRKRENKAMRGLVEKGEIMTGFLLTVVFVLVGYPIGKRLFSQNQSVKRKALGLLVILGGAFVFRII